MGTYNDKDNIKLRKVNEMLIAAIQRLKFEIKNRTAQERKLLRASMPYAHTIISAITFRDTKGIVHKVVEVKAHVTPNFLTRCLNSQCIWELDSLANPSECGYCRALVNIRRDNNYDWNDLCNITNFEMSISND